MRRQQYQPQGQEHILIKKVSRCVLTPNTIMHTVDNNAGLIVCGVWVSRSGVGHGWLVRSGVGSSA